MESDKYKPSLVFIENIKGELKYKAGNPEGTSIYFVKKVPGKNGIPQKILREIKALKKLNEQNQNIISLRIEADDDLYLIYPFYNISLYDLIKKRKEFTNDQLFYIVKQILTGLSYIHNNNIIHRNIEPKNILLTSSGNVVITGFGSSRDISNIMTIYKTSCYTALEVLLGDNNYNDTIDSWSLGCIMVEMKMYVKLFDEDDEILLAQQILKTFGDPECEYPFSKLFEVEKYKKPESFEQILQQKYGNIFDKKFLEVVKEFLITNKHHRLSARNALELTVFLTEYEVECNFSNEN